LGNFYRTAAFLFLFLCGTLHRKLFIKFGMIPARRVQDLVRVRPENWIEWFSSVCGDPDPIVLSPMGRDHFSPSPVERGGSRFGFPAPRAAFSRSSEVGWTRGYPSFNQLVSRLLFTPPLAVAMLLFVAISLDRYMGCHGANADLSRHLNRDEYGGDKKSFRFLEWKPSNFLAPEPSTRADDTRESVFASPLSEPGK